LSSKLRKLKQQAYEAGKKRDWSAAATAYAQILEVDKNNPSLLNEFGDICLKAGDITKALRQFLSAASKYKSTGLLNNAQAVYKKVLRHDPDNINANWFLAEIRAAQGLRAEGEQHAIKFLAAAENVSGEIKEIFLKRSQELFGLYPDSDPILERLERIFRVWDMPLEMARTRCLRACLQYAAGEADAAAALVQETVGTCSDVLNYPEYGRWQETIGARSAQSVESDVNTIELDGGDVASESAPDPVVEPTNDDTPESLPVAPAEVAPETAMAPAARDEASFGDLVPDESSAAPEESVADLEPSGGVAVCTDQTEPTEPTEDFPRDEEGCISIDCDEGSDFSSLMDDLSSAAVDALSGDGPESAPAAAPAQGAGTTGGGSVNLLDEILAEEGEDIVRSSANEQMSTIASEIGRNVGEQQEADPDAQYQQGLVYLEMGMYDQAVLSLEAAARSEEFALQAREMWGIALHRSGQPEAALEVFADGLATADPGDRLALGLRYHAGCILQELERTDEAHQHFRDVHTMDAGFADVAQRLRQTGA
jgi:tetratricopeptide (TPR) repeat protein